MGTCFNDSNCELTEGLFKKMYLIRRVEETLLDMFAKGKLTGTTHTSIGQEAIAASAMSFINEDDIVFSNHRCHGHFIAYGGEIKSLFAEVMGKSAGPCGGRGGSQHLCFKNFYTNGIQGGIVPNAVGAALAQKFKGRKGIGVVFIGDGTMGQGIVYESMNMASLWNVPILFVIENNRYAISTPVEEALSGNIAARARAFGISADEIESNNVLELWDLFKERFEYVRKNKRPFFQVINTYRLGPHSKGDDYRDINEIEKWRLKDPLSLIRNNIEYEKREEISRNIESIIEASIIESEMSPFECENFTDLDLNQYILDMKSFGDEGLYNLENNIRGSECINRALYEIMNSDDKTIIMGEDIRDPYGGAFKVTKGLSKEFSDRVINTPISEAGVIGVAIGLAMQGFKPIVEIMFGDFLAIGLDQILNHACKYEWMYNGKIKVPLIIRAPMGGRRGYGPTHSQSIEKLFMGIPGLIIVAQTNICDSGELFKRAYLHCDKPVIFIENKSLYSQRVYSIEGNKQGDFFIKKSEALFPTFLLSLDNFSPPDAAIITYGGNLDIAMKAAMDLLIEDEMVVNIILTTLISPVPISDIIDFIGNCEIVATVEEGTYSHGWGSEVIASIVCEDNKANKKRKFIKIASEDCPIPSNKRLESIILPDVEKIIKNIRRARDE